MDTIQTQPSPSAAQNPLIEVHEDVRHPTNVALAETYQVRLQGLADDPVTTVTLPAGTTVRALSVWLANLGQAVLYMTQSGADAHWSLISGEGRTVMHGWLALDEESPTGEGAFGIDRADEYRRDHTDHGDAVAVLPDGLTSDFDAIGETIVRVADEHEAHGDLGTSTGNRLMLQPVRS